MLKILFLYQDPNFFHAKLARAVGASFHPTPGLESLQKGPLNILANSLRATRYAAMIPGGYDIYLCETTYLYPAIAKRMGRLKGAKIINILASPFTYYIKAGTIGATQRKLALELLRDVDGFIAVGNMELELLKEMVGDAKVITVYPYIKPELMPRLKQAPDLDSHKILFRGSKDAYYKGIDLLVKAFRLVREKWPDAELTIAGDLRGIDPESNGVRGVNFAGYYKEKEVPRLTREASLYVHMGRGDAFPMTVLESMYGGLPAIVSEWTGTKEFVSKLGSNYVVPLNPAAAARQINRYFAATRNYRKELSKKARRIAGEFTMEKSISNFKKEYDGLLEQLYE